MIVTPSCPRTYATVHCMPNMEASRRLRALLAELDVNQSELARRMGHDDARQVRRWVAGTIPSVDNLGRIARALGVPKAELISLLFDEVDEELRGGS